MGATRSRLTEDFIQRLAEDFRLYGPEVIEKLRSEQPGKYVEAISRLVPQELLLTPNEHADLEDMSGEQLRDFMISEMKVIWGVELKSPAAITDGAKAT